MGVWKWESRHEDLAGEGREAVELPEMQPPEAATMRRGRSLRWRQGKCKLRAAWRRRKDGV